MTAEGQAYVSCRVCGATNLEGRRYCTSCWAKLAGSAPISVEAAERIAARRRTRVRARLLIKWGLVAAVIALVGVLIYDGAQPEPLPPAATTSASSASPPGQWTMAGHDPARSRYAPAGPEFAGRLKWKFQTADQLFAAPVATNDTVFLGTGDRRIVALDAATGAIRWQANVDTPVEAAPAVVGDRVFVAPRDGRLLAFDATSGRLLWTYRTDAFVAADLVIADGTVYVGDNNGYLHAVDAATGQRRWRTKTEGDSVHGGAVVMGSSIVVASGTKALVFDARSGDMVADHQIWLPVTSGPAASGDEFYLGARGSLRGFETEWRPPWFYRGSGRRLWLWGYLAGVAPRPPTGVRWTASFGRADLRPMAVSDDAFYFAESTGNVIALDKTTREQRWTTKSGSIIDAPVSVVGGGLYVGDLEGRVHAFDAATGAPRWQFTTGSAIRTGLATNATGLYVASSGGTLHALE